MHTYVNELASSVGTYLYGRRMYERQWQAAEKIVYSRTLAEPRSAGTRIEREFDPVAVRRLKAVTEHDITVDGPELAAQAIRGGLVDEFQMIVCPVVVGGGKRFFPDGVRHFVRQHRKHRPPAMGTMWSHPGLSCYTTAPADSVPRACSLSSGTIARGPSNSRPSTAPLAVRFSRDTPNSHWWIRWCGTTRRMAAQVNDFSLGQRPLCEWPSILEVLGVSPGW